MNKLFNIWHPHMVTSTRLILDITPADAALVRLGTRTFVSNCLAAIGLKETDSRWNIIVARQAYYSDYPLSSDWRARWDIVWILEVIFSSPLNFHDPVGVDPYTTAASDDSAEGYDEPNVINRALILASFPKEGNTELKIDEVVREWVVATGLSLAVPLMWVPQTGERLLVRALINSLTFPAAINNLLVLHEQLGKFGGETNWRDLAVLS